MTNNIEAEINLTAQPKNDRDKSRVAQIGINEKMLVKINDPNYITDILRLPVMSFLFNEIDFNKALKENSKNIRVKKNASSKK